MEIKLKPWEGNERLYFYRQSQQLAGQTGQVGRLRADFSKDGNGFFSSWEEIRPHLKTDEFNAPVYVNPAKGGPNPFEGGGETQIDDHDSSEFIGKGDDKPGEGIHF